MRFFFYGTLLDYDVAALVLGRRLPPMAFTAASLPGHVRRRAKGVSYPIIVQDRRGRVPGAVVTGLNAKDVVRLAVFEGPRYRIAPLKVNVAGVLTTVSVFEPVEHRIQPTVGSWDLADWQRDDKRTFIKRITRAISEHPAYSKK